MKSVFISICVLITLFLTGCSQTSATLPPVETAKIGTMIDSLQSGKSDVIAAMYETSERAEKMDFTAGYFPNPQVFVVSKDRLEEADNAK